VRCDVARDFAAEPIQALRTPTGPRLYLVALSHLWNSEHVCRLAAFDEYVDGSGQRDAEQAKTHFGEIRPRGLDLMFTSGPEIKSRLVNFNCGLGSPRGAAARLAVLCAAP